MIYSMMTDWSRDKILAMDGGGEDSVAYILLYRSVSPRDVVTDGQIGASMMSLHVDHFVLVIVIVYETRAVSPFGPHCS